MAEGVYGNDLSSLIDENDTKFESFLVELREPKCCGDKFKILLIGLATVFVFLPLIVAMLVIVQYKHSTPADTSFASVNGVSEAAEPGLFPKIISRVTICMSNSNCPPSGHNN